MWFVTKMIVKPKDPIRRFWWWDEDEPDATQDV